MGSLRYLTGGASHGPALVGILEGLPAGVKLDTNKINRELHRRQQGHGRGGRMKIEKDRIEIYSGIRWGKTTGAPITLFIKNRDFENWQEVMDPLSRPKNYQPVTIPRPGHADLAGAIKYGHDDLRDVIERASARETAIRVGLGAVAKQFLQQFSISIASYVIQIHEIKSKVAYDDLDISPAKLNERADKSPLRCLDRQAEKKMITRIDQARKNGDTVGGVFEVIARGVPVGLGSYIHWDRRLDGRIAQAMMSIPAIKGVEIGAGFDTAQRYGSQVQDEIFYNKNSKLFRKSNHAGGTEGGMSNGEPIVVRAAMKPISTLMQPLSSVDIKTKKKKKAHKERADVCAVPAASVVGEAVIGLVLVDALINKFGGDSLSEIKKRVKKSRR